MGSSSALAQLLEPFKSVHEPLVVLHEKHGSYGSGKDHEAGFDSKSLLFDQMHLTNELRLDDSRAFHQANVYAFRRKETGFTRLEH
jgi:hypothetical protein